MIGFFCTTAKANDLNIILSIILNIDFVLKIESMLVFNPLL